MASTITAGTLKVTIRESITLKGKEQGSTTELSVSDIITLTFRDENNTEFRIKVDAGHSFIYPGDNSGGVVDTMKAGGSALASGIDDLVDITVDADTAACDVEVFVASV